MDIFLVLLTIASFAITIWLFSLASVKNVDLSLGAWLAMNDTKSVWSVAELNKFKKAYWLIINTLKRWFGLEELVGNGGYPADLEYNGDTMLPKKIFVGDSYSLSLKLNRISSLPKVDAVEVFQTEESRTEKKVHVHFQLNDNGKQFLEIELQAAGLEVDGDKKQKQKLTSENITYHWNCAFMNSGNHVITLIFRLVDENSSFELGAINHGIKVAKLDGMTQRHVWILASLGALISTPLAIAVALRQLGLL